MYIYDVIFVYLHGLLGVEQNDRDTERFFWLQKRAGNF